MKIIKKIPTLEVKRTFIISNNINTKNNTRKHLKLTPLKEFEEKLQTATKKYLKMRETGLDKIIGQYKKRLVAYNSSDWYLAEISTNEVGVWKKAGELPLDWTNESLDETAKKIKNVLENNPKLLKKRAGYTIPNILKTNVQILQKKKYLFPIVFQDGTGTNGRKRIVKRLTGDIDDGSMRSIALAIAGCKTLKVYFGIPSELLKKV